MPKTKNTYFKWLFIEQKLRKGQLKFEQEKEKLKKQHKRMKDHEVKKKASEKFLSKKKEEAKIMETIWSFQRRGE